MSRTIVRWAAVGACWLLVAHSRAQDAPFHPEEAVVAPVRPQAAMPRFDITPFIFGASKPEDFRKKLERALDQEIGILDRKYELTTIQKKKLRLAGGHDIKRFFDEVEELKAEYARSNGDFNRVNQRVIRLQ